MVGACWPCMLCSISLIVSLSTGAFTIGLDGSVVSVPVIWGGLALLVLVLTCFGATAFSDPGIFPRFRSPRHPSWRYHSVTRTYRPRGVVFCRDNQLLVEKIDHFCPWVGTTVAMNNIWCFHIFTTSLCALCVFAGVLVLMASISAVGKD